MSSMTLSWVKCGQQGENWCLLSALQLEHYYFNGVEGVYVIWHGGPNPATVRVGQGVIRDRLAAHKQDPAIQNYAHYGLYVTWAEVQGRWRDGVEVYLAQSLNPLVGERFPSCVPVYVNLPW